MASAAVVVSETSAAARHVLLNREKALNALNLDMVRDLMPRYAQWYADHKKGKDMFVVMSGQGTKAFCAGGDVVSLCKNIKADGELCRRFFYEEYQLNNAILNAPFPHIALLDGIVMGGGVGLSVHGSHRICTEHTLFAMPETAIGLFPDVGGTHFLPRLPHRGMGMYLAMTGNRLKGADVVHAGIGTHYIPRERIGALREDLLHGASTATQAVECVEAHCTARDKLPPFSMEPKLRDVDEFFSCDKSTALEMVSKIRAAAKEGNTFAKESDAPLEAASPISVFITHEQIRRGKALAADSTISSTEYFALEYAMSQACMFSPRSDFFTGVQAKLIEKAKGVPKWTESSIEAIDANKETIIDDFFSMHQRSGVPKWQPHQSTYSSAKL